MKTINPKTPRKAPFPEIKLIMTREIAEYTQLKTKLMHKDNEFFQESLQTNLEMEGMKEQLCVFEVIFRKFNIYLTGVLERTGENYGKKCQSNNLKKKKNPRNEDKWKIYV